jgi:hypothetical protein
MKRWAMYVVTGGVVATGIWIAVGPLSRRVQTIQSNLEAIAADTGDLSSVTYQRFARRRKAVGDMRAGLVALAAAESAFVADSGRPTSMFLGAYAFRNHPSNLGPTIEIQRDRWIAHVSNVHTTITCSLTAMADTVTERYRPGETVCAGWTPQESLAIAMDTAPAYGYTPVPPRPPAQPEPHKRLDWGPVNNTPPRVPFIVSETCEGEGCTYRGTWAACSTVVARRDKRLDAARVFTIQSGDRFTALTADVHVVEPGIVVFRRPFTTTIPVDEVGLVDLTFTPADTLFVLNSLGEGVVVWRFRRTTIRGDVFWNPDTQPSPADTMALVRPAKTVWWVRVRNAAGQEGWIVGDYAKMATGGYMDEVERCLHTAKG